MVEITHGGTWFDWASMDSRDRFLFVLSTVTSVPAVLVPTLHMVRYAYQFGYRVGAGEHGPDPIGPYVESDLYRYAVLVAFVMLVVSLVAWWRFSIRQDELFNRIQNDAVGRAGAWTFVIATAWWILSLGGWIAPLPLWALVLGGCTLLLAFWFRAVRRCT